MHADAAIGAVLGTQAAADTPVFYHYFEGSSPPDSADRATDHAQGIAALAARRGNEVLVESQALPNEPGDAVMRVRTGPHAGVAPSALLQVQK
jgi:hypothetical protein